ncbi:aminotransferase class I/II-fold pyridoxal phosphate-dependent enzyme [Micromonospora sp. NBC_01813]|uniref:aminotransferase class I/II-fold pyridoxal phosphate-dependent enzyme n=1 Tax=Micromonospora sp. NBC_01813 TaxID=2975988 RepID=UPI002DD90FAC|nr:aminotransferase class I/II-fold pyridoxal phosphate-dependent enzyme [Micromonospora sp. NBC_01813]WSA07948.1 hypothetical protein OG958_27645 [Micromonospora sp. NBC_01813]
MIDLTGPIRPWPERLVARFAAAHERALRATSWWRTPAPQGEPALLDQLAELAGAPPERTAVVSGVRQFASAWAGRPTVPTVTVVETPTFADIPEIIGARGPVVCAAWEALPARSEPVTIWLTSPFRNPDGRSLDAGVIRALVAGGHTVVINEVYRWYADEHVASDGAWTVTSLAKIAGGGVRLGWVTAPEDAALGWESTAGAPPTAWQRAWADFLTPATLRTLRQECVEPTLDARRTFTGRMHDLTGWTITGGGPSLLLEITRPEPETVDALTRHGVMVSPGRAFLSDVASIRLSFSGATVAEAEKAAEILALLHEEFLST